ncbi:phosphoglycerate mutase [Paraphaeosphaeria sporulosa]
MARQVQLFLIRHGETVDNVAQLYAGSRDSMLTNHGYQQAIRLGSHFSSLGHSFTHLFSSHLQRAAKTAGLIREAQAKRDTHGSQQKVPDVVELSCLMEQDFGFYEGKKFYERPADGKLSGKDNHRQAHKDSEGFVDIESKASLARRADAFLDGHLLPLVNSPTGPSDLVVGIVSHGIMLSSLWKRILLRLPEKSVKLAPGLAASGPVTLEHLGGWSNTGFLELRMSRSVPVPLAPAPSATTDEISPEVAPLILIAPPRSEESSNSEAVSTEDPKVVTRTLLQAPTTSGLRKLDSDWSTVILTINGKDHLKNLKRTGGGVGSSRHDASQKNIDSFFKRRKVE